MIEERLSDNERKRIVQALIDGMVPGKRADRIVLGIIKKLSGVDTVVKVERSYPSAAVKTVSHVSEALRRIEAQANDE